MAALTDLSDIVNRLTDPTNGGPDHPTVYIEGRIAAAAASATVAGRYTSLWLWNKSNGSRGTAPGSGANPTRATQGAALIQANPAVGKQKWLLGVETIAQQQGILVLYDRLMHCSGLSATVITAQAITGGSVNRYTSTESVGNQIWLEIYSIIGTTATTVTASYTNQAGTSGRTTQATTFGGTGLREGERMIPLALADGDTGVQSVQSVTVLASTLTAGNFGVTIVRPILSIMCGGSGIAGVRDCIAGLPSVPEIETDACLALQWMPNGTTAGAMMLFAHFIEK